MIYNLILLIIVEVIQCHATPFSIYFKLYFFPKEKIKNKKETSSITSIFQLVKYLKIKVQSQTSK